MARVDEGEGERLCFAFDIGTIRDDEGGKRGAGGLAEDVDVEEGVFGPGLRSTASNLEIPSSRSSSVPSPL